MESGHRDAAVLLQPSGHIEAFAETPDFHCAGEAGVAYVGEVAVG